MSTASKQTMELSCRWLSDFTLRIKENKYRDDIQTRNHMTYYDFLAHAKRMYDQHLELCISGLGRNYSSTME
jgi:hypothetical protein